MRTIEAMWGTVTTCGVFINHDSNTNVTKGRQLLSTRTVEIVLSLVEINDVMSIREKEKQTGKNRRKLDQHVMRISENLVANITMTAMIIWNITSNRVALKDSVAILLARFMLTLAKLQAATSVATWLGALSSRQKLVVAAKTRLDCTFRMLSSL